MYFVFFLEHDIVVFLFNQTRWIRLVFKTVSGFCGFGFTARNFFLVLNLFQPEFCFQQS